MTQLSTADYINLITSIATAAGLFFAGWQILLSRKTTEGQFLLQIDQQLSAFDPIYKRLRMAHEHQEAPPPLAREDLIELREYMGALEILEILIANGSVSESVFKCIFAHRVNALVGHQQVCSEILEAAPARWQRFNQLAQRACA